MENDAEKIFSDLKKDISTYTGLKYRLVKLIAIEKAAGTLSALSHGFILLLFSCFTILFLFIALGFFLGDLLGNVAWGFLIVGGIYLILTLVFVWAKSGIQMRLMNIFINALQPTNRDDDKEEDKHFAYSPGKVVDGEANDPATMSGGRDED